ncbi:MAG: hypothetical protein M1839_007856 [Geoglossum umbratile]|nr:MAG: hypothetical protein M1839_007856 [Geoglossum umbratile]
MQDQGYPTDYKPAYTPVAPVESPYRMGDAETARIEAHDAKLKRQTRILKIFQRAASFALSIAIAAIMAMTLAKYLNTRNTTVGGKSPWPTRTVLWPTIMLFSISATAFLLYTGIIISYFFSYQAANTMSTITSVFSVLFGLIRFTAWVVAAVLYQIGQRTGRDLRGWSCGGSDNLSEALHAVVNFDLICKTNTSSFHLTYVSAIVEAFGVVVWIWIGRRFLSKRAVARRQSRGPAF